MSQQLASPGGMLRRSARLAVAAIVGDASVLDSAGDRGMQKTDSFSSNGSAAPAGPVADVGPTPPDTSSGSDSMPSQEESAPLPSAVRDHSAGTHAPGGANFLRSIRNHLATWPAVLSRLPFRSCPKLPKMLAFPEIELSLGKSSTRKTAYDMFDKVVQLVKNRLLGDGNTYPFIRFRGTPTGAVSEWILANRERIQQHLENYYRLDHIARELSREMGLKQQLTATHLRDRATRLGIPPLSAPPLVNEEVSAYTLCVEFCILALNFVRRVPMWVPLDLISLFREVPFEDWVFASCIMVGELTGVCLDPGAAVRVVKILGRAGFPRGETNAWDAFTHRPRDPKYDAVVAAAGGRPSETALPGDLEFHDCLALPATPDKGGLHLAKGLWRICPAPTEEHDNDVTQALRHIVHGEEYAYGPQTIRFRGFPTSCNPVLAPWRYLEYLMTPALSASTHINVIITRLAYRRTTSGHPEVEISFADRLHAHTARLTMAQWIHHLGLTTPVEVPLPGASGKDHPLSQLRAELQGGVPMLVSNIRAQAMFALADPEVPVVAHVYERISHDQSGKKTHVRISFASPVAAKSMMGRQFPYAHGRNGTAHLLFSSHLEPHLSLSQPEVCTNCWRMGHTKEMCLEVVSDFLEPNDGRCPLCAEEHELPAVRCPYIGIYFNQASRLLQNTLHHMQHNIFAPEHDALFSEVFARYDDPPFHRPDDIDSVDIGSVDSWSSSEDDFMPDDRDFMPENPDFLRDGSD
ncbi:related to putative dual specificity protein kinase pom1 (C-terminal fragment) [Sporisorium scitamineum]|uniref:Related to putative dual specificity protein kinase pom1 (C-terminal) n=1 Tax=Sporisorium scitamineum TaxID=49012 RepID=A0A0F7S580_9BASI|nr:related to putative dual specificity protein kinase pom1 (C-terminal fragment) [Sporisorium scitamineum]CDW97491.1 hypothetical protein [Sporisorium scitamineum]